MGDSYTIKMGEKNNNDVKCAHKTGDDSVTKRVDRWCCGLGYYYLAG